MDVQAVRCEVRFANDSVLDDQPIREVPIQHADDLLSPRLFRYPFGRCLRDCRLQ
jgi:hypothetical protein